MLAIAVAALLKADLRDPVYWKTLGYPGVFFFSLLGSASVMLPLPGIVAVCGASGLDLNPAAVGLAAAVGETIGELSGYMVGFGGRGVVEQRRLYHLVNGLMRRRGALILFVMSTIPNPFFDVAGIAAGATRFPLSRFIIAVGLGKTIKSLAVAYSCFYGIKQLPWVG